MAIDYTKRPGANPLSGNEPPAGAPAAPPAGSGFPPPSGFPAQPNGPGFPAPSGPPAAGFPPPAPPAAAPGVSLSKVTLTKAAPAVSLSKGGQASGVIRINLNWSAQAPGGKKKGFFGRLTAQDETDLDLGCLYELSDGTKGVIQALGKSFGELNRPPHIFLDGDDRSGAVTAGENMFINLEQPQRFRRILVFAMIYSGAANWGAADGVVTLYPQSGPEVEVRLDATASDARMCAIALIENRGGDIVVQREVKYVTGNQRSLDQAYNWGLDWTPGRK